MRVQPTRSKFQEFQAQNKRSLLAQLNTMIEEFEQMILSLEDQISGEKHQSNKHPHDHFAHDNFMRAAKTRRDNLYKSVTNLKKQRDSVAVELADIESESQVMRMRKSSFRRSSSSRAIMV